MATFQEAIDPSSVEGYKALFLIELAANGSLVNGWTPGAPQRGFLDGEARAQFSQSIITSTLAKTASPETCIDAGSSWVDAVVGWFRLSNGQGGYGRFQATQAVWSIPMKITPATLTMTIDNTTEIVVQSESGVYFECSQQSEITLNFSTVYKGSIRFTARLAGTTGNVSPGQITKIVSGPAGLSLDLVGTQVLSTAARDQETDQQYVDRALASWGREGSGWTVTAYDYWIPVFGNNGTTLAVTRWYIDDTNPDGPGTTHVWIANAAGPASGAEVTAVQTGLMSATVKSLGSGATTVEACVSHPLTITATITTDGSNGNVAAQAAAAIATLSAAFPIGPCELEPDLVTTILMGAPLVSAPIFAGATYKTVPLNLAGFSSVIDVTSLSLAATEAIGLGEVLVITLVLTVLP